ncbi:sigma-54 interaction domain-containing protein [Rhodoferax sp.]|uniref:sigma-54 interaction domain-containing protein n=1 Tax=Rhodoferax sp. TaxID=50421 RepID=UPI002765B3F7|nr:sigma-54 dependent transcriptional regulator [Rhodoferax sp.]
MSTRYSFHLLGSSDAFAQARSQIERVAKVDATVLIEGETGTGKEMAARAIHYLGKRCDLPFVPVNCGALAEALIESELFGHERGAFTDAKVASLGLVHEAGGGTLFLDEVDALSLKAQATLLRFLQDGTYRRVGGASTRQADVRVVVASNANLQVLAEERRFRKDLLYRVNVLGVRMPALRERGDDAVELARVFLGRLAHQYERPAARLAPVSLAFLRSHPWPGNVRELENVVHRAYLLSDGPDIDLARAAQGGGAHAAAPVCPQGFRQAKQRAMGDFERQYLSDLLQQTRGNLTQAALLAGQDRSAFGRLVRKHGLRQPPAQPQPQAQPGGA